MGRIVGQIGEASNVRTTTLGERKTLNSKHVDSCSRKSVAHWRTIFFNFQLIEKD